MKFLYVLTTLLFVFQGFTAPNDEGEPALASFVKAFFDPLLSLEHIKQLRSPVKDINQAVSIIFEDRTTRMITPLMAACTNRSPQGAAALLYLLEQGADVNDYTPPLLYRYCHNQEFPLSLTEILLQAGADTTYQDPTTQISPSRSRRGWEC